MRGQNQHTTDEPRSSTMPPARVHEDQREAAEAMAARARTPGGLGDLLRQGLFAIGACEPRGDEVCRCKQKEVEERWPYTCLACGLFVDG